MKGHWIIKAGKESWGRDGWSEFRQPVTFRTKEEAMKAMGYLDTDKDVRPVHVVHPD